MRFLPLLALSLMACSDYSNTLAPKDGAYDTGGGAWGADTGDQAGAGDGDDTASENESDYLKLAPAATDQYVFVANPGRDTVTRIAVSTLDVQTVGVGRIPSTVQTTSDYRLALTLDEGDDAVSRIYAETLDVEQVGIRDNMNQLDLSPDGQFAMAWFDPDAESLGTSDGVTSFNEVSFVRTDPLVHYPMAVGYGPKGVRWSDDGKRAIVVSDGSLALVDLTAETPKAELIPLADDELDAPVAEEVVLTPDGKYAFVRQRGVEDLVVVDLDNQVVDHVTVGNDPTDMDVAPDGASLAVVARTARQIWSFDVENPYATPAVVDFPSDSPYGSISFGGDGSHALLYTNAAAIDSLAIWDVDGGGFDERTLVKPVASIGLSPTGDTAIVFHTKTDVADADPKDPFYGNWAVTLMETDGLGENRLLLPSEPTGYTVTDDNEWGYFILDGMQLLEACSFETLIPDQVSLASVPVFVGTLPGHNAAWVSQKHDLGRLSFYDPSARTLDTLTGFELNSDIEH